jgi:hypothetical protein
MSMPADTPDDVANLPSSTQRASSTQRTRSPWLVASAKNCLFEVARCPSSRPARASSAEPEHTDMTTRASAARARRNPSSASFCSSGTVPTPPGSSTRSSLGQSSKPNSASALGPWAERTGPGVWATVTMPSS